jgi:hypothetical protein
MTQQVHATSHHHPNDLPSKDCPWPNYWYNDICHHQPPPRPVAIINFHCDNNKCESSGWVPINPSVNQTSLRCNHLEERDGDKCCDRTYDGAPGLCGGQNWDP